MPKYICSFFFLFILLHGYTQPCDTAIGFQNMFWFKGIGNFDNIGYPGIKTIMEDAGENIISVGNIRVSGTPSAPSKNIVLITKTNPKGTLLWTKTFMQTLSNLFTNVILTKDNGYFLVVNVYSGGDGNNTLMIKLNTDGKVEWSSSLSKQEVALGLSHIIQLKDESFIATGGGGYRGGYNYNLITRMNKQGKPIWNKLFF